ncbi:unnamed protein product [Echinostoma caproni]|uniref:AH domain-containing protein n=1 Tax=Echinostoma caproni TaxID=27848 RepID=A0A183A6L8_9TREM|nr:unnamed protein product [Echinostoma caproni]
MVDLAVAVVAAVPVAGVAAVAVLVVDVVVDLRVIKAVDVVAATALAVAVFAAITDIVMLAYIERLSRGAQCTRVCKDAQIYSLLFGRNVNRFQGGRAISNMARISKTLDYQMRIAAYVRLLGVLMSKVTNYLCSASKIMTNDQVLRSADDIALMFLQRRCSEVAYRASVTAFKKDLDNSSTIALKTSLAMVEHNVIVLVYEAKLNTTDNYGGYRRMDIVFKDKDELLGSIVDAFERQTEIMTDAVLNNLLNLVRLTEEFAVRDLELARFDSPEDVEADTGVKMLQESLSKIKDEMFEVIQVLMNNFIDPSKAEKELLIVLTSMPHQLKSDDTAAIEGVNQAFQRMLYNPGVYKE